MKYQLTCPNCHYEWHYDNGYYDDNITRLGIEIHDNKVEIVVNPAPSLQSSPTSFV